MNKEIIFFFKDIGDSTNFDLELAKDGNQNNGSVTGTATFLLLLDVWHLQSKKQQTVQVD